MGKDTFARVTAQSRGGTLGLSKTRLFSIPFYLGSLRRCIVNRLIRYPRNSGPPCAGFAVNRRRRTFSSAAARTALVGASAKLSGEGYRRWGSGNGDLWRDVLRSPSKAATSVHFRPEFSNRRAPIGLLYGGRVFVRDPAARIVRFKTALLFFFR